MASKGKLCAQGAVGPESGAGLHLWRTQGWEAGPPHQRGWPDSALLVPPELPSVMLLNGDCPEGLKKEAGAPEPPRENGLDEAEPGEETTGQEVIVIQDTGFSVKILAPGIEPFSLQVRWWRGSVDQGLSLSGRGWKATLCPCSVWPSLCCRQEMEGPMPSKVTQLAWRMWESRSRPLSHGWRWIPAGTASPVWGALGRDWV